MEQNMPGNSSGTGPDNSGGMGPGNSSGMGPRNSGGIGLGNTGRPQPGQRKYPFLTILGPLMGYWGIQMAVQFILQIIIELPYMVKAYSKVFETGEMLTFQEAMERYTKLVLPAIDAVIKYQVEISGIAALCTLPLIVYFFLQDKKLRSAWGWEEPGRLSRSKYWMPLIFGAVGSIGASCLAYMAQLVLYDAEYGQAAQEMYAAPVLVQVAVLGIVMPVAEEFMFRGVLFRRFLEQRSFFYSMLWSSVFFCLMHTNGVQMIYTFLLGLMLCWVYQKYGSLKAPLCLHIAANLSAVICTEAGILDWLESEPFRMAVMSILAAFICSVLYVRMNSQKPE